jgi:signal recognition particle receptor subunit beta
MKIGEIAVITPNSKTSENFIKSICKKIDIRNGVVSFGRFNANDQLGLHIYGISLDNKEKKLSWDLISRKMLGYIVIFDWEDQISLETIKPILDKLSDNLPTPVIVVANVKNINQAPIPPIFFFPDGIHISENFRFSFVQANRP